MSLADEDIQRIMQALESTDVFQWVKQQMAAEQGSADGMGGDPAGAPPDMGGAPPDMGGGPPDMGGAPPAPPAAPPGPPSAAPADNPPPTDEKDKAMQYARDAANVRRSYARVVAENSGLKAEHAALKARVDGIERSKRLVERYSQLDKLSYEHVFDLPEERARAERLSDAEFADHCGVISTRYQRIPVGSARINPVASPQVGANPKSESRKELAVQIYTRGVSDGKVMTYEEANELAGKQLGIK